MIILSYNNFFNWYILCGHRNSFDPSPHAKMHMLSCLLVLLFHKGVYNFF